MKRRATNRTAILVSLQFCLNLLSSCEVSAPMHRMDRKASSLPAHLLDQESEAAMARGTQRCPNCGAVVPLSGSAEGDSDIQCPECGSWYAARGFDSIHPPSSQSNTGLWIALSLGGAFLVLLLVCGGIGVAVMLVGRQRMQAQQAVMERTA